MHCIECYLNTTKKDEWAYTDEPWLGDEIVLVDYKFSSLSADKLRARYSQQIKLYSQALEKSFGKKIEKRYLLSLKNGEVIKL